MFAASEAPNLLYVIAIPMILLALMVGISYALWHVWGKDKSE